MKVSHVKNALIGKFISKASNRGESNIFQLYSPSGEDLGGAWEWTVHWIKDATPRGWSQLYIVIEYSLSSRTSEIPQGHWSTNWHNLGLYCKPTTDLWMDIASVVLPAILLHKLSPSLGNSKAHSSSVVAGSLGMALQELLPLRELETAEWGKNRLMWTDAYEQESVFYCEIIKSSY